MEDCEGCGACCALMGCIFLDADNRCMIYENRPPECRRENTGSTDEDCRAVRRLMGKE